MFRYFKTLPWKCSLLLTTLFLPVFSQAQPVRGVAGDLWADLVLGPSLPSGQPNWASVSPNIVNASGIYKASVTADPNPAHHRIYVWDAGNSRVLGFSDTTQLSPNQGGSQTGFTADIVLGQPDSYHCGCNGDNNDQLWPAYVPPSQTSLCGMWQRQGSIAEGGGGSAMAVDPATGDLYVPDTFNNRVLRYAYANLVSGAQGVTASGVWGQTDYASYLVNQGLSGPNNSSLFFNGATSSSSVGGCADAAGQVPFAAGVGIDGNGNLWVADNHNNRVLRFPHSAALGMPQPTADLVLGQSAFNVANQGSVLNPVAVRTDLFGNVFVLSNNSIQVFYASSFAGQPAQPTPDYTYSSSILTAAFSMDMDGSGNLWVANIGVGGYPGSGNVVEFQPQYTGSSVTGLTPINALGQDTLPPAAPSGSYGESGPNFQYADGNSTYSAFPQVSTVAVDGNGNVFVSGAGNNGNLFRFPAPIPTPQTGKSYSADVEIFKPIEPGGVNQTGLNGLSAAPYGVAVAQAVSTPQVIVSDGQRIDYWNIPPGGLGPGQTALASGQAPDGFAGSGVNSQSVTLLGEVGNTFTRIRVDHSTGATGSQHLWVIDNQATAQVYSLPLSPWATPTTAVNTNVPVLGAPTSLVDWSGVGGLSGLNDLMPASSVSAPYASGPVSYLWVADNWHSRVFRVLDPLGQLGLGPKVDILIGQTTASNNTCGNFGTLASGSCSGSVPMNQYTLSWPGFAVQDHAGNLYVSDFSLETAGNGRLLEYDEWEIEQATNNSLSTGQIQFLSNSVSYTGATHVYDRAGQFGPVNHDPAAANDPAGYLYDPLAVAFPSDDRAMVASVFEWLTAVVPNPHSNFDPFDPVNPWTHLNDFYSNLYSATFDDQDNLYTVDSNRSRVLVYYNPIPKSNLTPQPTPTPTPAVTPGCNQVLWNLPAPTQGFNAPGVMALDYTRSLLYVSNQDKQTVEVYHYSQGAVPVYTGSLQGVNFSVSSMVFDNQGNLYMASGAQVYKTALGNGGLSALSPTVIINLPYGIHGIYVEPSGTTLYLVEGGVSTFLVQRYDNPGTGYALTSSIDSGQVLGGILVANNTGTNQNTVYVGGYYNYVILYLTETVTGSTSTFSSPVTMGLPSVVAYPWDFKTDLAGNVYVCGAAGGMIILSPHSPTQWYLDYSLSFNAGPIAAGVDPYGDIYGSMASSIVGQPNGYVAEIRGCLAEPTLTPTNTPLPLTPTVTPTGTPTLTPTETLSPTPISCVPLNSLAVSQPEGVALDGRQTLYAADEAASQVDVFNSAGSPQAPLGTGVFAEPMGVAVDGNGKVLATDAALDEVFLFNGGSYSQWGTTGNAVGQLEEPVGIAVNSAGTSVYVADQDNSRIQVFTEQGSPLASWGSFGIAGNGTFISPTGVALDPSGNVYVADWDTGLVQVFTSNGTPVSVNGNPLQWDVTQGTPLFTANFIAVYGNCLVYVTDGYGTVGMFDLNGNPLGYSQGGSNPFIDTEGIASGNGTWCVADPGAGLVEGYGTCPNAGCTFTPAPSWTPSPPPLTQSPTPTAFLTPTPSPTLTPTFTASATPTYSPTVTPTFTPSSTPSNSPTSSPSFTPTITATEGCDEPRFYPNPVRGGGSMSLHLPPCDQGQEVHLKIFTLAFRKVVDRDVTQWNQGVNGVLNLTDDWGRPLANGLYYLVIDRMEGRTIGKILILQ
jgi:hypothetical protein